MAVAAYPSLEAAAALAVDYDSTQDVVAGAMRRTNPHASGSLMLTYHAARSYAFYAIAVSVGMPFIGEVHRLAVPIIVTEGWVAQS